MSFFSKLLGRPLATPEGEKKELNVATGVPALGLDAVASTAYGPEAAIAILLPLGAVGLQYFFPITIGIIFLLLILFLSYRQTIAAYPNGAGAYKVTTDNFGPDVGLWAAVALLIDYLLNVTVGIAAGVGALVSAFPLLHPFMLEICLFVLFTLTVINLRGVRKSGILFLFPLIMFVLCLGLVMAVGLYKLWISTSSHLVPVIAPPTIPTMTENVSTWILLGAFANGLTAMTGIEAVSNAVPIFHKPVIQNAQRTLSIIVLILALFLLALAFLDPAYQIGAMDQRLPGYQTLFSQLIGAVIGHGVFYTIAMASIFIILIFSAQTSFVAFPRVCKLLAEDSYMPHFFADRGRRLVYSHGIIVLACLATILILVFKGITNALIPLFAVGSFSAFLFSQAGMIKHWKKKGIKKHWHKFLLNAIGAFGTAIALTIIIVEKFLAGAWIVIVLALLMVYLFKYVNLHYQNINKIIEKPLDMQPPDLRKSLVIIPIEALNHKAEASFKTALLMTDDIIALHISNEKDSEDHYLRKEWKEKMEKLNQIKDLTLQLVIIQSRFRRIHGPIIDFVKKMQSENPQYLIAVIIPELINPHWYDYCLHNVSAEILRASILLERDEHIIVINTAWY